MNHELNCGRHADLSCLASIVILFFSMPIVVYIATGLINLLRGVV